MIFSPRFLTVRSKLLLSIKNTISERRRSKFGALRKRWMVKVGLSTRGIPPCYLLMILTNPHPPTHKHTQRNTKHTELRQRTNTIQHTSIQRVQKQWRINSVNGCSLLYPVSVCLSLCSVDSYSCPLLSSTTQSYQGTHYTAPSSNPCHEPTTISTMGKVTTVSSFLFYSSPSDHFVLLVAFC